MERFNKIKIDLENENTIALLNFISETQEGKYTDEKPELNQVTYKRLQIQEQENVHCLDDFNEGVLLFGVSY